MAPRRRGSDPADPASTIDVSDARALRALAHPLRLTLLGLLRREGPLTATQSGELVGESPAACSYHLRQLAKYGFVEEAGGGHGRERPWRATAQFTRWPGVAADPGLAAAVDVFTARVGELYVDRIRRWVAARPNEPEAWQQAALFGDTSLYLTPAELTALGAQVRALATPFLERNVDPALRPAESRLVSMLQLAFPSQSETVP